MADDRVAKLGKNKHRELLMSVEDSWVLIESLKVEASIGVYDWEKRVRQSLEFDLALRCDFSQSAKSDKVEDAVDYAQVCALVAELCQSTHHDLLECLAEKILQACFEGFPVFEISMTIRKPGAVPAAKSVGVKIHRTRKEVLAV